MVACLAAAGVQAAQLAHWTKGTTPGNYSEPANWDIGVVPLNDASQTYVVEIPANAQVSYDVAGANQIDALRLNDDASFTLDGAREFTVLGVSIINGPVTANGAGAIFRSDAAAATLGGRAQLLVTGGAEVHVRAPAFDMTADWRGHREIFGADGAGSVLDLGSMQTLTTYGGNSGAWDYTVRAANGGTVNLSGLLTATGPRTDAYSNDDFLTFRVQTGGTLDLSNLRTSQRRVRFAPEQDWTLPAFETARMGWFQPAAGVTFDLPEWLTMDGGRIDVPDTAVINAPKLTAIRNSTIAVAPGGTLNAPQVADLTGSGLTLEPGANVQLGSVSAIDRMTFTARATPAFTFSATSYTLPDDWRASRTLLRAEGSGVSVDLSSLQQITVGGGHWGAWDYSVAAVDGAVLDLSGLVEATGPRTDDYSNDDWLSFYFQSGGQIRLDSLTRTSRKVRFLPDAGESYALPSLQQADGTYFNVPSGSVVDLPSLEEAVNTRFDVDFAGQVNAPSLTRLANTSLNIQPGGTFNAPALSDISGSSLPLGKGENFVAGSLSTIDAANIVLSGAASLTFSATSYELPADWRAHRALFHATAAGAVLNLGSLQTLTTHGGHGGAWEYSVLAENGGVIDLSGLVQATGPRTDDYNNDDWLSFYLNAGGQIDLSSLTTVSRRTRFYVREDWALPNLATVEMGYFYPAEGVTLDLPALAEMQAGRLDIPAGAVLNAPQATALRGATIPVADGGRLNAPQVTDLKGSALTINPAADVVFGDIAVVDQLQLIARRTPAFTISATSYTDYEDYRASRDFFIAENAGTHLDLSSLQLVTVPGGHWGSWDHRVLARNNATIDLTGLTAAVGGRTDTYSADDWLSIRAETGGFIELGQVVLSRVARLQVADSSAAIKAVDVEVRAPSRIQISDFGTLELTRRLTFNNTDEGQIALDAAVVKFTGAGPQWLEVGGQDGGAGGATSGNFGIGRLEVGAPGQPAVLQLVDLVDNGNRGAGGEPEALYLYGLDLEGLVLHPGSRLVLGDINVYTLHGGSMVHLNSLLGGADAVNFGDGVISRVGGPAITAMTPSGQVLPVVDHVDVTFNTPIDPATFTAADVQITGTAGPVAVTSITPLGGNDYRIHFPGQADHGEVVVRIGPDIADATGLLLKMDQNGNGLAGEPADVFEGRFLVDTHGPAVVSAVTLRNSDVVGVLFDEEVEPGSLADPSHYTIGGVPPDPVVPRADNRSVELHFPPQEGDTFLIETVGLVDLLGNEVATPQTFEGTVLSLASMQVGSPSGPRQAYTHDGTTFEVKAGGSDIWSNNDYFQFYAEPRTGDFDVKLRVVALNGPYYARVGLMAREHTGNNSRHLAVMVYQPNRANVIGFHRRLVQGGTTDNWAGDLGGVPLPNAWIRLQRSGNTFRAYTSTDGENWVQRAQTTFELPDTLLVGIAPCAADGNPNNGTTATLADWGDYSPSFVRQPQSQTVFQGQTARLLAEARGVGELTYQWYFNGNPIPGATRPLLELANIQPAQAGDYHVVAQNAIGSVTSEVATVRVDTSDPGAGFEADLMPRNTGDGTLGVADWTMVGRMAVGLETPANASEFTRADCAPRSTLGNGVLSIGDWVQAGRYAAGLDPKTPAGGPNGISPLGLDGAASAAPTAARELYLLNTTAEPGELRLAVMLRGMGDENSLGFSLSFDARRLALAGVSAGDSAPGAMLVVNDREAAEGRIGVALALPAGKRLLPGENQIALVRFRRLSAEPARVALSSQPVALEAAGVEAETLMLTAAEASGPWAPPAMGVLRAELAAGTVRVTYQTVPGAVVRFETSTNLTDWTAAGEAVTAGPDGQARLVLPIGDSHRFFRVAPGR